jgi:hypothetical protein
LLRRKVQAGELGARRRNPDGAEDEQRAEESERSHVHSFSAAFTFGGWMVKPVRR